MGARNPSLKNLRRRAAFLLLAQTVAIAAAPCAVIFGAYVTLALFGLANPWLFAAALALALISLIWRAKSVSWPKPRQIEHQIETASGLRHRPFDALTDSPETANETALALWIMYQERAALALSTARAGRPDVQATARDPYALRGLLLLLLATGLVIAGPAAPSRLSDAFTLPAWPFPGPSVNAWITPPAYDSAPPILLTPGQPVTALAGSRLTIIVNGMSSPPVIRLPGAGFTNTALAAGSFRADATLTQTGHLRIGPWWQRLAAWRITVTPPAAPNLAITTIDPSTPGTLRLAWRLSDPYGIAQLALRLRPEGGPAALPESFTLGPSAQAAKLNVAGTPYGGLRLELAVTATNEAGIAASVTLPVTLPPIRLHDKTAILLSGLRQRLALQPKSLTWIGADLGQVAAAPPSIITAAADLQIAALSSAMAAQQTTAPAAVTKLSALIDEVEAGPQYAAKRALTAANDALMRALHDGLNGQPPGATALQALLQKLQNALAQRLAGLPPPAGHMPGGQQINLSDLDRLAQKIAQDEAAGNAAQAQQEMRQLQNALNALQSAQPMTAAQAAQAQAAQQAAGALSQLTNGEAQLLDQTHQGTAIAQGQQALSASLSHLQNALNRAGIPLPGLAGAAQAMADAQNALTNGNTGRAESSETAAIKNLQQAASSLAAAAPETFSLGGQGGEAPGETQSGDGTNGGPDENPMAGTAAMPANPADAIQQQIMKQDGNPALPAPAHQYFHRLLTPDGD
jgi:hypothetical protein